jgi:hypothetical protein
MYNSTSLCTRRISVRRVRILRRKSVAWADRDTKLFVAKILPAIVEVQRTYRDGAA